MAWPVSQDYNEAIQSPASSFSDAELRRGVAACNALGLPMPRSGNFADVYEVACGNRKYAVKCFTREIPGLRDRYKHISEYLKQKPFPFMVDFHYLEQGIRIKGSWFPALKMEWVEGYTLNEFIKEQAAQPAVLDTLAQMWVKLSSRLREGYLAHCDLQHGNVLLVPGKREHSLAVKLVDYDGMCVPALTLLKSIEMGHANFQHPQRARERIYNLEVDRFSHLVIYTALRALIGGGRELWDRFDNGDNLLFKLSDFEAPVRSHLFAELLRSNDPGVRILAETMLNALSKPLAETPVLEEVAAKLPPPKLPPVTRSRTRLKRQTKAKRGLIAAAIVGMLLVAGVGAYLATRGDNSSKNQALAKSNPTNSSEAPSVTPAKTPTDPEPKNKEEPKEKGKEPKPKERPKDPEPKGKTEPEPEPKEKTEPAEADDPWLQRISKLPPDQQIKEVGVELQKRNPGFVGKIDGKTGSGAIIELAFVTDQVKDMSPVRALARLQRLSCAGSGPGKGRLASLAPLKGLKLTSLNCSHNPLSDLSVLQGMSLAALQCQGTSISDLSPLEGAPLKTLNCGLTKVADLTSLKGSQLTHLTLTDAPVASLDALEGISLVFLDISGTKVSSLEPLRGMPLTTLHCVLRPAADLAPLKEMPLKEVTCDFQMDRDAPALRPIKTLEKINGKSAAEFWKDQRQTNSIGMKLAYMPPGKFLMGSPNTEEKREPREGPQHEVVISRPFYMAIYEVKQSEFEKIMSRNPSANRNASAFEGNPSHPVEQVTWDEAVEFCKKLSELPDEKKAGRGYRLPTEAEWEYACRAGSTTVFHFGNALSSQQANFNGDQPYGGAPKGERLGKTTKVGSYEPNLWGLYDMHGNVSEWCLDGTRTYAKRDGAIEDPKGPMAMGGQRVLRGGSWSNGAWACRSAARYPDAPNLRYGSIGFRVILVR